MYLLERERCGKGEGECFERGGEGREIGGRGKERERCGKGEENVLLWRVLRIDTN